jgi:hypothetical protein
MSLKPTSIPTKTLAASITALSSSFKLNNILGWDATALTSASFGTQAYCVFRNANRTRLELMEFDPTTIGNTSITIIRRGLKFDGDLTTEVSGNKYAWTKGDTFIDIGTDSPQVIQWLKEYIDAASIAGITQDSFDTFLSTSDQLLPAAVISAETTSGVTHSLTTLAGQRVLVWAKGSRTADNADYTTTLSYNGVSKDSITTNGATSSDKIAFTLMYTETPGAATADITVTTSGGSLSDVKIIVLKF